MNSTNRLFGSNDTWHFVPYSAFSFRHTVLLNPHNLATQTFVNSLEVLTWSFAMGYQLAYELEWVRAGLGGQGAACVLLDVCVCLERAFNACLVVRLPLPWPGGQAEPGSRHVAARNARVSALAHCGAR